MKKETFLDLKVRNHTLHSCPVVPARNPFTGEYQNEQDLQRERMLLNANPRMPLMWAASRCPECDFDQGIGDERAVKVCAWCGVARD